MLRTTLLIAGLAALAASVTACVPYYRDGYYARSAPYGGTDYYDAAGRLHRGANEDYGRPRAGYRYDDRYDDRYDEDRYGR